MYANSFILIAFMIVHTVQINCLEKKIAGLVMQMQDQQFQGISVAVDASKCHPDDLIVKKNQMR